MKRLYFLLLAAFLGLPAMAQTTQYNGYVRDTAGQALEFINVAALRLPDSAVLGGTITNHEGFFSLSLRAERDSMLFRVGALGYKTVFLPSAALDSITLQPSSTELSAVMVRGKQKIFQLKDDKLVCNVSGTALASENSTNEIIGKLPGFFLRGDELVSLQKGGIKYFINNRPVSPEEVSRLNPGTIKTIDIDRHPGARFSGEIGTVVYIHTQKLLEGFSAYVHSYTRVNHRISQRVDGEASYQYKQVRVTLGADLSMYQAKTGQQNSFELLDSSWKFSTQDTKERNRSFYQTYFVALAYSPSDRHHLQARYKFEPGSFSALLVGDMVLRKKRDTLREDFTTKATGRSYEHSVNFNYSGQLGNSFAVDIASDWYQEQKRNTFTAEEKGRTAESVTKARSTLLGLSPRISYRPNLFRFELGGDFTLSNVKGATAFNIDDVLPTDNKIEELKGAGYLNGGWTSVSKQWDLNLGLRYEAVSKEYNDYSAPTPQRQHFFYHTVLPSLSVAYTSSGAWHHQVAYRPSIEYPAFSQLSGGEAYINRYTLKRSNPRLSRSVTHSVSYSVAFRWLYLSAGYNYTFNPILETFEREAFKKEYRVVVYPKNLDRMQGFEIIANASPRFGFYEPRYMLGYIQNFMTLYEEPRGNRTVTRPLIVVSLNNSFSLPQNWGISLDYTFNSPGSSGFVEYTLTHSLNASIKKSFFNRSLRVSLSAVDLLGMSAPRIQGSIQGVQIQSYSWMDTRSVRLNISWYFQKYQSRDTRSSISSEIRRL